MNLSGSDLQRLVDEERKVVVVVEDEARTVRAAIRALARDPEVFVRKGALVRLSGRGLYKISTAMLQAVYLPRNSIWVEYQDDTEDFKRVEVSLSIAEAVCLAGLWPRIRVIKEFTNQSMQRPNGTWIETPGYDAESGVLYLPKEVSR